MSRILFVVPPLTGHINPTVAVGAELAARGHDVAWAGHQAALRSLLPEGARVFPVSGDAPDAGMASAGMASAGMAGAGIGLMAACGRPAPGWPACRTTDGRHAAPRR